VRKTLSFSKSWQNHFLAIRFFLTHYNLKLHLYKELMNLFVKINYKDWHFLECHTNPANKVQSIIKQLDTGKK
jgi:hypothetical protein